MRDRGIQRPYAEERIWRPLADRPNCLGDGYTGAIPLHQVQLGDQSGYADLILLLPHRDPEKLVVVEAKHARDGRSSADGTYKTVRDSRGPIRREASHPRIEIQAVRVLRQLRLRGIGERRPR
jgi:hypothetical protein